MKKTGLVGGISWVSTMDYYRFINEEVNARLGGLNAGECIIYSLNFDDVQEKGWLNAFDLLLNACENLKKAGADGIALCANTAHLYADRLKEKINLPFIDIVDETAKEITRKGFRKAALLGTRFTMEQDFYKKKLEVYSLEVLTPEKQETRDYIQQTIRDELGVGLINPGTKANYISIVKELTDHGADCLILGCTEIPILISQDDFTIPVFDTTKIHSKAIVGFMLA